MLVLAFLWKNKGCLIHKRTLISRPNVCWLRIEGFKNQINMLSTKNWFIATLLVNFLSLFEYYSNTNFLVIKITFNLVFSFLGILLYSCSSFKEEINGILWTYLIEKKGFYNIIAIVQSSLHLCYKWKKILHYITPFLYVLPNLSN